MGPLLEKDVCQMRNFDSGGTIRCDFSVQVLSGCGNSLKTTAVDAGNFSKIGSWSMDSDKFSNRGASS